MRTVVGRGARPPAPSPFEERIELRRSGSPRDRLAEMAEDVRRGLAAERKWLPPKWFYDARGSRLFERITRLPEYYLTRAEIEILRRSAHDLVRGSRPEALVEFGSGSSEKTRILLDAMREAGVLRSYAPIDVSGAALTEAAERLAACYPELEVVGVIGDFGGPLRLPFGDRRRLVAFLGSTIGNLVPREAEAFLRRFGEQLGPEDGFLIGFDLVKDRETLEAAYDDAAGVTAEFNRNVLRVLNRELGADFDPGAFRHRATWNPEAARMEMRLVSEVARTVRFEALDLEIRLGAGEAILTELSHKYTRESVESLLASAGLALARWETDARGRFALGLARA